MADADEKAKAEKLAAAKKRVEQIKKQKAKKAGGAAKKDGPADAPAEPSPTISATKEDIEEYTEKEDVPAATTSPRVSIPSGGPLSPGFRGPTSPDMETASAIYRKHVARIEELERENRGLAKDAAESEKRWKKVEEELADLRESDGDGSGKKAGRGGSQVEALKAELAALQRQNAQLQARRHGSSPSVSLSSPPEEVSALLASRAATIETMELEMSRLRAQVERLSSPEKSASEQVTALEDKVARAEKAAGAAQRELADLKRNLERASEKAVREGSERASAETRVRSLEKEAAEARLLAEAEGRRAGALEKKAAALTTLHREQDSRSQALRREREKAAAEAESLRARLESAEAENLRLRKREARDGGGTDDDGVDELEDEGRARLESRVRELEAENLDLRRGIWRDRRREMQPGPDGDEAPGAGRFTEVELGGASGHGPASPALRKASAAAGGIGDFFASGLNALTGVAAAGGGGGGGAGGRRHGDHPDDGGLLPDDDDDDDDDEMEFDEGAFRRAHEEEAKKRIERVREVKRTLKNWEGWRLDLVESRTGGGEGTGEIFEV